MTKTLSIPLIVIFAIFSASLSQNIQPTTQYSWLTLLPEFFINGLYYIPPLFSYNETSNSIQEIAISECDAGYMITANFMVWCTNTQAGPKGFKTVTLYQISLDLSEILNSWVLPGIPPNEDVLDLDFGGYYLNFYFPTYFISFDTFALEFVCPVSKKQDGTFGVFLNTSVVTIGYDGLNAEIMLSPCKGNSPIITIGKNEGVQGAIIGMNRSTVIVRELDYEERTYFSAGIFDLAGKFHFGQSYFEASGENINDTHIALLSPSGLGIYVISPSLTFVQVANFPLNINSTQLEILVIKGTEQVYVLFEGGSFLYDFSSSSIVEVFSNRPPLIFNNGSVVNLTIHGYFIQNPGQSIYFIKNEILQYYTNATDSTKIYGFYALNNNGSFNTPCQLLVIDTENNIIKNVTYNECPVNGLADIHDVVYDSEGNLAMAYTDAVTQELYILTSAKLLGPFSAVKGISPISISVNLITGTAKFAGFNYTNVKQFIGGSFSLLSGNLIQTANLTVNSQENYITKLTENYYLAVTSTPNLATTMFVWNTTGLNQINPIHLQSYCNQTDFFGLGVSEFNPNIFNTAICQHGTTSYSIISSSGNFTTLSVTPGNVLTEIQKVDNLTFAVFQENVEFSYESFYQLNI